MVFLTFAATFLISCGSFSDALSGLLNKNSGGSESSQSVNESEKLEGSSSSTTDEASPSDNSSEESEDFESSASSEEGETPEYGSSSEESETSESSSEDDGEEDTYLYNDFTAAEKQTFIQLIGETIPFMPNDDYIVEPYDDEYETGIAFCVAGSTRAEFDAYCALFTSYTLDEIWYDDSDFAYYIYRKGDFYVDVSFVDEDTDTYVEVYAYLLKDDWSGEDWGGSDDSSNGDWNGDHDADGDVMTNDGKGLPQGENGVYEVDFTAATNVQDVTDQGYYLGGCPTSGSPAVLVIPVEFSDVTAKSKGYETAVLQEAFSRGGNTDYYSVYDYYFTSSYGKLTLDITVLDFWFKPKNTSAYYQNATQDYYGDQIAIGDQMIMDEALAYLSKTMDLSRFDSDDNGMIDAVVLVNTLDIGEDDFHWAYRYWNLYTDKNDEYYEYDGVSANDYLWASYQFLNDSGDGNYSDKNAVNTYTYIHEMGHVLGADDYYDTAGVADPMGGCDVMDGMLGDHNAFTKFNYGWVTTSRLVTTDNSVTLQLDDFSKSGDSVILANNFDPTLGAYQEYYLVTYYKSVDLNAGEGGYFARDGIVVYHVNASLYKEVVEGETYYDVKYNNTHPSDDYGTENNLIEYVLNGKGEYTYAVGDKLPTTTTDGGKQLAYTFTVDALNEDFATITFTKR